MREHTATPGPRSTPFVGLSGVGFSCPPGEGGGSQPWERRLEPPSPSPRGRGDPSGFPFPHLAPILPAGERAKHSGQYYPRKNPPLVILRRGTASAFGCAGAAMGTDLRCQRTRDGCSSQERANQVIGPSRPNVACRDLSLADDFRLWGARTATSLFGSPSTSGSWPHDVSRGHRKST